MTTEVGDKGLVFSAGSPYSTFSTVGTPSVGDKVTLYNLGSDQRLAVPTLAFTLTDQVWVIPDFPFKGFKWKYDFKLGVLNIGGRKMWILQTAAAEWTARYLHNLVSLPDGSVVLTGGTQVWHSLDQGVSWHQHTTGTPWWSTPGGYSTLTLLDGSILLTGGSAPKNNQVWHSLDAGVSWHQHTTGTPWWSARYNHSTVLMPDGSIILTGGYDESTPILNDVWRSTDAGETWVQQTAAAGWSKREWHTTVAFADASIVLMGGWVGPDWFDASREVWQSTDLGVNWTRLTETAEWLGSMNHGSVVISDGSIILMRGAGDVWRSTDYGATWTTLGDAEYGNRFSIACCRLSDDSIVVAGGVRPDNTRLNDVWRYP